ncbi:MAG: aliphatic sulfonate ABC transporter substrate-binding protein [Hyphomicrobiaceae bacterium]|nr:aliphatic sulfonate ABC transporter substrate-binding protein [Hyphomicrobiaceae bacterium]
MVKVNRRNFLKGLGAGAALTVLPAPFVKASQSLETLTVDFATYNPVSLLIRDRGLFEEAFAADGIAIRWVQSLGSNKALEFLNAGSIDIGSTAGAAALVGSINGNPIKSIGVYSRPEWTALVTRPDTGIEKVEDLVGRPVAVTRGTDPHIFLVRALLGAGLTERDLRLVLLQHGDGKTALIRGDVDAWAGLDPMMAAAELEDDARLFYRDAAANTWGILNAREDFLAAHPAIAEKVLEIYEQGRQLALAEPDALAASLQQQTGLDAAIIARQLERTDISHAAIGDLQKETIVEAGRALQTAGVLDASIDVEAAAGALIDPRYGITG